jgi:nucleotide-binding universal stress UspA family protein
MAEIKRVVIPVDFTSTMDKVVEYAASVADKLGARVLFLHVVNDFKGYEMMLVHPSFAMITDDLKAQSEERMAALVEDYQHLKGGASGRVMVGDAAEKIITFAEEENADMIIIATHGIKGLEKMLMGSTAEKVVKKASCPVLTFNPFK